MGTILKIVFIIARIYMIYKVASLLFLTSINPETYPMEKLYWWICFLIFDIWLQFILATPQETEDFK